MGHDIYFNSAIEFTPRNSPKTKEIQKCDDFIDRRYFWFIDEHIWNQEKSILSQLEKLLNIPLKWLGDIKHGEELASDFEEGKFEENFIEIESSLRILAKLSQKLAEGTSLDGKLVFTLDMSKVNREYYPKYVEEGEFLQDVKHIIRLLKCYKNAGETKFTMHWL